MNGGLEVAIDWEDYHRENNPTVVQVVWASGMVHVWDWRYPWGQWQPRALYPRADLLPRVSPAQALGTVPR